MDDRGYPESWPEFARMLIRDRKRRRNFALLVPAMPAMAAVIAAAIAGGLWLMARGW